MKVHRGSKCLVQEIKCFAIIKPDKSMLRVELYCGDNYFHSNIKARGGYSGN